MDHKLNLAEELLLLALKEDAGTIRLAAVTALPYGLAGALLIELVLAGRVRIDGKRLVPAPAGSAGDELLDGYLAALRSAPRARTIASWVRRFGQKAGRPKHVLLDRLVAKRILTKEERHVFWIFMTYRYPRADAMAGHRIRERVRSAVRGLGAPDERTAALIGLVHACELVGAVFEKDERREARKRAKAIAAAQPIGAAVAQAVQAVRAAVIAAGGS